MKTFFIDSGSMSWNSERADWNHFTVLGADYVAIPCPCTDDSIHQASPMRRSQEGSP